MSNLLHNPSIPLWTLHKKSKSYDGYFSPVVHHHDNARPFNILNDCYRIYSQSNGRRYCHLLPSVSWVAVINSTAKIRGNILLVLIFYILKNRSLCECSI